MLQTPLHAAESMRRRGTRSICDIQSASLLIRRGPVREPGPFEHADAPSWSYADCLRALTNSHPVRSESRHAIRRSIFTRRRWLDAVTAAYPARLARRRTTASRWQGWSHAPTDGANCEFSGNADHDIESSCERARDRRGPARHDPRRERLGRLRTRFRRSSSISASRSSTWSRPRSALSSALVGRTP